MQMLIHATACVFLFDCSTITEMCPMLSVTKMPLNFPCQLFVNPPQTSHKIDDMVKQKNISLMYIFRWYFCILQSTQ